MQWFYDGQIRRYITQVVRVFSNFVVKYGDGTLRQIPVVYGDMDRQVATVLRQNTANSLNSVPRIAVYVTGLDLDRDRLADATYVGKMHFRERDVNSSGNYTQAQGRNYTVERLMPTPYKLTLKCDIWSSSTDQKLQIMEQLLVLFNPSLEIQSSDNYLDWTSLTVLNLDSINWSSRQVPQGNDTPIEVGTLTLTTPIWINPPAKVKHLGVITKVITSIWAQDSTYPSGYIDGLGIDPVLQTDGTTTNFSNLIAQETTTITGYKIQVYDGQATLLDAGVGVNPPEPNLGIPSPTSVTVNWEELFSQYPGQYTAGSSQLFLLQPSGNYVIGTIAVNPTNPTLLQINYNPDTVPTNTGIDSQGYLQTDVADYQQHGTQYRSNSPGTFDAIINPQTYTPQNLTVGKRYLLVEDIGAAINNTNSTSSQVWGQLIAKANDVIEYNGTTWHVIFNAAQETDTMVWQTNIYTGVQYLWNGVSWTKSFEGEYSAAQWKIVL
jgi:hypothetical protein